MDSKEFRRLRVGVISNLPPASGAALDSAASLLHRRLAASDMFAEVTVTVTEDVDRLLSAVVSYRPGTPVRQVSSYLEAVWVAEVRLPGLDAFHFVTVGNRIELEAVTGDSASRHFITLHLVADEGTAQDFERRTPVEAEVVVTKKRWFRR